MRHYFCFRVTGDVGVGLIARTVRNIERCAFLIVVVLGVRDRRVANVVRQVLSYVHVVSVVDNLICLPLGVGTRVDNLQLAQPTLNGPIEVIEGVFDLVGTIALHAGRIASKGGVSGKRAVRLQFLCHRAQEQAPLVGKLKAS